MIRKRTCFVLIFTILVLNLSLLLTGCNSDSSKSKDITETENSNTETIFEGQLIKISDLFENGEHLIICYDKNTKIMYYYYSGFHRGGLSPYYVVEDGKAEIGIYDVNYTE